jgi:hypothetical protein
MFIDSRSPHLHISTRSQRGAWLRVEGLNKRIIRGYKYYAPNGALQVLLPPAARVTYHTQSTEKENALAETHKGPTTADLFRRGQAIRGEKPDASYKEIAAQLVREFSGGPLPPTYNLTIPEQDARAPEEDWSAGLPLVLRGIQQKDWPGIAQGIVLSLEQTENYELQRGHEGTRDDWHDRSKGVAGATAKGVGKWMPEELMKLAERNVRER